MNSKSEQTTNVCSKKLKTNFWEIFLGIFLTELIKEMYPFRLHFEDTV